jgi:hypothetical protein
MLITRVQRCAAGAALWIICGLVSWLAIWACYRFRFDPTPHVGVPLDRGALYYQLGIRPPKTIPVFAGEIPEDLRLKSRLAPFLRCLLQHHLLPEAYLHGLLYQMTTTEVRSAFLMGRYSMTGWWYYFPLAMLFKTPVATELTILASFIAAIVLLKRHRPASQGVWSIICIALPFVVFLGASMSSHLNIGLRHVFPLYPLMYIAAGTVIAKLDILRAGMLRPIAGGVALLLAVESFAAFPDFIAYFNFAFGGSRGGLELLGDSNLDWGQDLPLLRVWQEEHPTAPLYVYYFGVVPPGVYGIVEQTQRPGRDAVYAISATNLQDIYYATAASRARMARLRRQTPLAVLGGTIYLYPASAIESAADLRAASAPR